MQKKVIIGIVCATAVLYNAKEACVVFPEGSCDIVNHVMEKSIYQVLELPYVQDLTRESTKIWVIVWRWIYWILQTLKIDRFCHKCNKRLGPFLQSLRFVIHFLRQYTEAARGSIRSNLGGIKDKWFERSHITQWDTLASTKFKAVLDFDEDEHEKGDTLRDDEEAEEEEEEQEQEILGIEKKVQNEGKIIEEIHREGIEIFHSPDDKNLNTAIDESMSLRFEFDAWTKSITKRLEQCIPALDNETESRITALTNEFNVTFQTSIADITAQMKVEVKKIIETIETIDCIAKVDPDTQSLVYYDVSGKNVLDQYISRPLLQALFKNTYELVNAFQSQTESQLDKWDTYIDKVVSQIHDEAIEVYEEWGDIMISQWSQRMAYADVVIDSTQFQPETWKTFLDLKNRVLDTRDILANHVTNKSHLLSDFRSSIESQLNELESSFQLDLNDLHKRADTAFRNRELHESAAMDESIVLQTDPTSIALNLL